MKSKLSKKQESIKEFNAKFKDIKADEAIKALKEFATGSKVDQTLELAVQLGIDMKMSDQQVRTSAALPAGTGKKVRIAVIAKGEKVTEAKDAGAEFVGEDIIKKIEDGWTDFDVLVATPDTMAQVGKLGRVLGPKGLMPNPKDGTVTMDVAKAVKELQAGKVGIRAEKTGSVVHLPIGKLSFSDEDLLKNFGAAITEIQRAKPSAAKGTYMKSVYLSTTQGPGVRIASDSLSAVVSAAA